MGSEEIFNELPFKEARTVFMLRSRMCSTKNNFKGRWSTKSECEFCYEIETDVHLFSCVGYRDLLQDIPYTMFISLVDPMEILSVGAKKLLLVMNRLECINKCIKKVISKKK